MVDGFHAEHAREYNFRREDSPVSIFRVGVKAIGVVQKAKLPSFEVVKHVPEPAGKRAVWFKGKRCEAAIYNREEIKAGAEFVGPAIVEQIDSTVVVPPNTNATVDKYLNILIRVKG